MKRVHYVDNYLINPQHPVTVNVIGAGGTGSQVLTCLSRLDVSLRGLGHPGFFVAVYDPDTVTEANIGRQLFGPMDLGLNKAQCLITRINNFFGNDWKAEARPYPPVLKELKQDEIANITITCTDNVKSRLDLWNVLGKITASSYTDNCTPLYWMDFGNTQTSGQVVLGTVPKKIKQPVSRLQATGFPALRNCKLAESHHPAGEIREREGERFRSELLAGGGPGKAGPVHQFHISAVGLQHPVEDVPPRVD